VRNRTAGEELRRRARLKPRAQFASSAESVHKLRRGEPNEIVRDLAGRLFVNSGYASTGGMAGNTLLAFCVK
jgi:hypothetical protein